MINLSNPDNFKDDPYAWLTNQISHTAVSFTFAYLTGLVYPTLVFWLVWELRHYLMSNDLADSLEDLFFELSGLLLFVCPDEYMPIYLVVFSILGLRRIA